MSANSLAITDDTFSGKNSVLDCQEQCSMALYGCYDAIRCCVMKLNGNLEDVDDIFQETYIALLPKWAGIDGLSQVLIRLYICGISRKLWLKEIKRRKTEVKCLVEYMYECELSKMYIIGVFFYKSGYIEFC